MSFSPFRKTGIIDILQPFSWRKRAERFLKTAVLRRPAADIAVADPPAFAQRFLGMLDARLV